MAEKQPKFTRMPGEGKLLLLAEQKNLPSLIVKMLKEVPHGITVTLDAAHKRNVKEGKIPNGFYSFKGDRIHLTQLDPHVLAHEMGHAEFDTSLLGKILQSRILYPLYSIGPLAGMTGGEVFREVKHPVARAAAVGIPFLLTAPAMVAEAMASAHGHEILKGIGASPEELKAYRKKVAKYYLTYAAFPAATGVTLAIGANAR